jgi:hypothetical protein
MKPSRDISGLLEIMQALRTPKTGCPWDLEQNFATIAPTAWPTLLRTLSELRRTWPTWVGMRSSETGKRRC